MRSYPLAALAAAGAIILTANCSKKEPEDVTPSAAPSVSKEAAEDTARAAAGAVQDSAAAAAGAVQDSAAAAMPADSMGVRPDTLHTPADTIHRDSM